MGYDKGTLSKERIIQAAGTIVLAKGYAATSIADLSKAAETSAGKLTHHFPTKADLFEAVFDGMMLQFKTGPLNLLGDTSRSPQSRIKAFFDAVYQLYAVQPDPIGCPVGHAASDSEGVSSSMRKGALDVLKETEKEFSKAFEDMGHSRTQARINAMIFVSAWQGAVVVARAGDGIKHIEKVFSALQSGTVPQSSD
jgi:TetR/AcrR family transcriptional regulator, transcriptional repressor for nem operon